MRWFSFPDIHRFIIHTLFPFILPTPIFPLLPQQTNTISPFLQQTTDTFISDCKKVFFWIGVGVDEVQTPGLGGGEDTGTSGEVTSELWGRAYKCLGRLGGG